MLATEDEHPAGVRRMIQIDPAERPDHAPAAGAGRRYDDIDEMQALTDKYAIQLKVAQERLSNLVRERDRLTAGAK